MTNRHKKKKYSGPSVVQTQVKQKHQQREAHKAKFKGGASKKLSRQHLAEKRQEIKHNLLTRKRTNTSLCAAASAMLLTKDCMSDSMDQLKRQAAKDQSHYREKQMSAAAAADALASSFHVADSSRKTYMKELRKVVEHADVILQILDARDPLGCRYREVEDLIVGARDKKMVLVLNKADLVPPENLKHWLSYLRQSFPTLPFKANLNSATNTCTDGLMQLLKNYCRQGGLSMKLAITVGVVGYPNVGKSSLINALKRSKAVGTSPVAGFTKVMQEIHLDKKIKLLDCPGIVFDDSDPSALLLRNCLNIETLGDPVAAAQVVFNRCAESQLQALYPELRGWTISVTTHASSSSSSPYLRFLAQLAKQRGKLVKGGVADVMASAKILLQDWNSGRIPFCTAPPPLETSETSGVLLESHVVSTFAPEYQLDLTLVEPLPVLQLVEEPSPEADMPKVENLPMCHAPRFQQHSLNQAGEKNSDLVLRSEKYDDSDDDDFDPVANVANRQTTVQVVPVKSKPQKLTLTLEDQLNPMTARLARRSAKQKRKEKRREKVRRVDTVTENAICDFVSQLAMVSPAAIGQQVVVNRHH